MANSAFYDATKEDSRSWRDDHDTRAGAADEAAVANAASLQDDTQATNPVDGFDATPSTTTLATTTGTQQITVTPKVGTVATTSGMSVTYSSSSTGKATVSSSGLITGVAAGTSTITVTAVHDTSLTDTVVVTVP